MVKISVLNDCLKSMYNAEKRGKRQVRRPGCGRWSKTGEERRGRGVGNNPRGRPPGCFLAAQFKAPGPHRPCHETPWVAER